jgi:hypothetical protein
VDKFPHETGTNMNCHKKFGNQKRSTGEVQNATSSTSLCLIYLASDAILMIKLPGFSGNYFRFTEMGVNDDMKLFIMTPAVSLDNAFAS